MSKPAVLIVLLIVSLTSPIHVGGITTASMVNDELFVGGQEGSILEGSMLTVSGDYTYGSHMCIILAEEEIYCRGGNMYGQLGNGQSYQQPGYSENYVDLPENISVINEITSDKNNGAYNCAIVNNGEVICWGTYDDNQNLWVQLTPVFVDLPANRSAVSIESFGWYYGVRVILDNGELYCIDIFQCGPFGLEIEDPVLAIGGGDTGTLACAALQNMTVYCRGTISGDHTTTDYWIELENEWNANLSNSSFSMTVGDQHVCYLLLTYEVNPVRTAQCFGQIRLPQQNVHQQWMTISGSHDAVAITSGSNHHCALVYNGSVYCTGSDQYGQLGRGYFGGPSHQMSYVELPDNLTATSIYAHTYGTCAVLTNNSTSNYLYCWGYFPMPQYSDYTTPTLIQLNSEIKQLSRDVDNDGVLNNFDLCNFDEINWNSNSISDFDGDGCKDNSVDYDDDNDLHLDSNDMCPKSLQNFNWSDYYQNNNHSLNGFDFDNDGCHNTEDLDDDNDGILDANDIFPFDTYEWADFDGDGLGDNSDRDNDNDGWHDDIEMNCMTEHLNYTSVPLDTDGDWICNLIDEDDDGDGYSDSADIFPLDSAEWSDTDQDGIGDNSDADDDNDGWIDLEDQFPFDASEHADQDGDGIGNNVDDDDDGDGTNETYDCNDRDVAVGSIMEDLDCDGEINDVDIDDDGDNVMDVDDFCPHGETNWTSGAVLGTDIDGDGCRDDGEDIDDDGDGVDDNADAYPDDPSRWEIGEEGPSELGGGNFTIMILVGTIICLTITLVVVVKRK